MKLDSFACHCEARSDEAVPMMLRTHLRIASPRLRGFVSLIPPLFISSQTLGGDSGSDFGCIPIADAIALAMTAATGTMPPSPAPLAPSGLFGDGYSSMSNTRMLGKPAAVGSA